MSLKPKKHIKTYHTLNDVVEYHIDTFNRVYVTTYLTNGKERSVSFDLKEFMEINKGSEIASLIQDEIWPM